MNAWESSIIRISSGQLNTCNDSVVGGQETLSGRSMFQGQLGKVVFFSQEQIAQVSKASIGTLYAGGYQYVHLSEDSAAVARGQAAFWDLTEALGDFIITDDPTPTVPDSVNFAGVFLNVITPGNYGFIQWLGQATVQLIASVTDTTLGSAITPSLVASPSNHAMFNAIDDNSGLSANPRLNVGYATATPSNSALITAQLAPMTWRG